MYRAQTRNFACMQCRHVTACNVGTRLCLLRGKSPNMGRFPNMIRCIISYQEVLCLRM